jgi:hypothetical protein
MDLFGIELIGRLEPYFIGKTLVKGGFEFDAKAEMLCLRQERNTEH